MCGVRPRPGAAGTPAHSSVHSKTHTEHGLKLIGWHIVTSLFTSILGKGLPQCWDESQFLHLLLVFLGGQSVTICSLPRGGQQAPSSLPLTILCQGGRTGKIALSPLLIPSQVYLSQQFMGTFSLCMSDEYIPCPVCMGEIIFVKFGHVFEVLVQCKLPFYIL